MTFAPSFLDGRAALVTGGGTGIGRGIALALASFGCNVAVVSRRAEHVEPAADEIQRRGVRALACTGDVRDGGAMEQTMRLVDEAFGRLDILVNAAAGNFVCLAEDLSPNGFGAVVDIDLKGTFNASRAALPYLKRQGGAVVNISATLQYLGTAGQVHAASAKAGIDTMTRVLAVEWGPYGIRVNAVAPGPTAETEGVRRLTSAATKQAAERHCPLGRLASIDDTSNIVLFLCSDAASFITGTVLAVDGVPVAEVRPDDRGAGFVELRHVELVHAGREPRPGEPRPGATCRTRCRRRSSAFRSAAATPRPSRSRRRDRECDPRAAA